MVFGRTFINETRLVYNEKKGTVMFEQDDEKITFKMPHTMEIFKQTKLMGLSTDSIPMKDRGDKRGIRHLMRLEKEMMDDKGGVT
ncbi:hypothetical protein Tco_0763514 [Tanacetum coccineum]